MTIKFAVTREDPDLEDEVLARTPARRALVVASGGCTPLTLAARRPELLVSAFDINPAQLRHVREKLEAVAARDLRALGVEAGPCTDPRGLNQRGEFEKLFRILRALLCEFVTSEAELRTFFTPTTHPEIRQAFVERWAADRYFPVAFELAFHDTFLHAMFGPAATQHAEPGSYPRYFREAFLRGLRAEEAHKNPFLQHVLLGAYLPGDAPDYTRAGRFLDVELIEGSLPEVPELGRYDLYSLSNVFDWSGDELVAAWADVLKAAARPGSAVLLRQLNNRRDLRRFFAPEFQFDDALGEELLRRDRSLFYCRVEVGFRVGSRAGSPA
jgi:S-adenosylmethionine-diacylglycerol 3-amino-3-carboxypropyl transferase